MTSRLSFVAILTAILLVGFTASASLSYFWANQSADDKVLEDTLPLTGDNIYSEIQKDLLQSILVSSLMAQDTFVQSWVIQGEQNPEQIIRYLQSIQQRYQAVTAFFISDTSRTYYHSSGILKVISPQDPSDLWYFNVAKLKQNYEVNLDKDSAALDRTTFFVNHKVITSDNVFLGVIGVGLSSDIVIKAIDAYQDRYQRTIYFSDKQGNIVLHGKSFQAIDNISQKPGMKALASSVLQQQASSYTYQGPEGNIFLSTRFVPDLNWYLFVEQQQAVAPKVIDALWFNLGISFVFTSVIVFLTLRKVNIYQRQIERLAGRDQLTKTLSRNSFEPTFENLINDAQNKQTPMAIILMDIDNFKQVNDNFGHLAGDEVLAEVANILKLNLRKSDIVCRWGGEEFLIALLDCDLDQVQAIAEKKRLLIEATISTADNNRVTASFGVAKLAKGDCSKKLFSKADKALYQAKNEGRNKVIAA